MSTLNEPPAREGALAQRLLDDDLELVVYAMAYGNTRLVIGIPGAPDYLDGWCFHDPTACLAAAGEWDGTGHPPGWYRHLRTDARNPDHACTADWCREPSTTNPDPATR